MRLLNNLPLWAHVLVSLITVALVAAAALGVVGPTSGVWLVLLAAFSCYSLLRGWYDDTKWFVARRGLKREFGCYFFLLEAAWRHPNPDVRLIHQYAALAVADLYVGAIGALWVVHYAFSVDARQVWAVMAIGLVLLTSWLISDYVESRASQSKRCQ
jgi:hypothetical protein